MTRRTQNNIYMMSFQALKVNWLVTDFPDAEPEAVKVSSEKKKRRWGKAEWEGATVACMSINSRTFEETYESQADAGAAQRKI